MEKMALIILIRSKPIIHGRLLIIMKTVLCMKMINMLLIWRKVIIVSISDL